MRRRIYGPFTGGYKGAPEETYDQKYVDRYQKYIEAESAYYDLYPEVCRSYTPHIEKYLDRLDRSFFQSPPNKVHLDRMTEEIYQQMSRENPDLVKSERELERQFGYGFGYGYGTGFVRPLLGALLIAAILRRRRRFFPYYGHYGLY